MGKNGVGSLLRLAIPHLKETHQSQKTRDPLRIPYAPRRSAVHL
jgi:hypothetical protein